MESKEKPFSTVVLDVRKQLGLSQEDLARQIGVSFATVNRWENSRTSPSKLARAHFDSFYRKQLKEGRIAFPGDDE